MTSIWDTIKADVESAEQKIVAFAKSVVTADVAAVLPIAEAGVANLVTTEITDVTSGNTKVTGNDLAAVVSSTVKAAETAGIQTTAQTILTAVATALPANTSVKS